MFKIENSTTTKENWKSNSAFENELKNKENLIKSSNKDHICGIKKFPAVQIVEYKSCFANEIHETVLIPKIDLRSDYFLYYFLYEYLKEQNLSTTLPY